MKYLFKLAVLAVACWVAVAYGGWGWYFLLWTFIWTYTGVD